ncbi:hypothetical protein RB213_006513 [Colletotrichum asianum]
MMFEGTGLLGSGERGLLAKSRLCVGPAKCL